MPDYTARIPFRFFSCMELRESFGKRAYDERRLVELIQEVPADSIYYHTHSYYLRHPSAQELYPSDFATWAAIHAQDRVLGERLSVLEPFEFKNLEDLRRELVATIEHHLHHGKTVRPRKADKSFDFVRSHVIDVDLGIEVMTLGDFKYALRQVEVGAVYYHLCEARMRTRRPRTDFASWLSSEAGLQSPDLGDQVARIGRLGLSLEGMRTRLVQMCDLVLAQPEKQREA